MDEKQMISLLRERVILGCLNHVYILKSMAEKNTCQFETLKLIEQDLGILDELQHK